MMQPGKKVSELDKNVIRALQGDFPLVEEPYKELAARAGMSEEVFLARVKEMTEQKMIRKMGAVCVTARLDFLQMFSAPGRFRRSASTRWRRRWRPRCLSRIATIGTSRRDGRTISTR